LNAEEAARAVSDLAEAGFRTGACGHTLVPGVWDVCGRRQYRDGEPIRMRGSGGFLVNPGSVGQPRDGDPRGSFCVFDDEERTLFFRRFDYDIAETARRIRAAGLPEMLAARLFLGR
jgi:diadenosine tetraphosphatase ApaH/serine/threonine PP2A family protein phosphatase